MRKPIRFGLLVGAVITPALHVATAFAQTPPNVDAGVSPDSMVVEGVAPIPAGREIRIEALDPTTIRSITCGTAITSAIEGSPSSQFAITVNDSCFAGAAANLRICWGADICRAFDFEGGRRINLGLLARGEAEIIVPDAGGGAHLADTERSHASLIAIVFGLFMIAFGGMFSVTAMIRARPSRRE